MTRIKNILAFDGTVTTLTQKVQENGFCHMLIVLVADFTNSVTATVSILDVDGYVVWSSSALTKNTTNRIDSLTTPAFGLVPFDYDYQIKVVLSGAAGGTGGNVTVVGYIEPE